MFKLYFSSIDENKCLSFCKEDGANLVNHTASQLIRIYPAGKRVDSSNYNPIVPWANGCQIGKSKISIEVFQPPYWGSIGLD